MAVAGRRAGQPVQPDLCSTSTSSRPSTTPSGTRPVDRLLSESAAHRGRGSRVRSRLPVRRRRVRRPPTPQPMLALRCRSSQRIRTAVHRVRPTLASTAATSTSRPRSAWPRSQRTVRPGPTSSSQPTAPCFVAKRGGRDRIADAAKGLFLGGRSLLQEPTPVDSSASAVDGTVGAFRSDRAKPIWARHCSPRPNPDGSRLGRGARLAARGARIATPEPAGPPVS